MFGCENVKPILYSHHAQIILPLLGLCNIMSYVFWQQLPCVLHLSPARPSKAAHIEHSRIYGSQLQMLGKKTLCFSEKWVQMQAGIGTQRKGQSRNCSWESSPIRNQTLRPREVFISAVFSKSETLISQRQSQTIPLAKSGKMLRQTMCSH